MKYVCKRKYTNTSRFPDFSSLRKRQVKSKRKFKFTCNDGPLKGQSLYLSVAGTFIFSMQGFRGFYNFEMDWVNV